MHKTGLTILAASAMSLSLVSPGAALPPVGFSMPPEVNDQSAIDETRLVCVNRWGRILHYGPCGGWRYRVVYRPRYRWVCRNAWSGRIIHYGRC